MLVFACVTAQAADGIDITRNTIESTEAGYRLDAVYEFDLNVGLQQALQGGMPLYFTTEIEMTRPRWYWTDDRAVFTRRTVRLDYDVLARVYHVVVAGSLQQTWDTLEEALRAVKRPPRWLVASRGDLKPGESYNVTLRMFMDREYLRKPLQIDALNNSEWRLTSHKKTFTYRAE